jgi:hypothetical protein
VQASSGSRDREQQPGTRSDKARLVRRGLMASFKSSPLSRIVAGCIMVVLAALILLHTTASGMSSIADQEKSSVVSKWRSFDTQQQCLRDAITRAVPRGSAVMISNDQSTFLRLELVELSIPWLTPVATQSEAAYTMRIVPGSQCGGESLSTETVR